MDEKKKIFIGSTKQPARTFAVNLKCDCGGTITAVRPIKYCLESNLFLHKCNACKKEIYADNVYPCAVTVSDGEEQPNGVIEVYEN